MNILVFQTALLLVLAFVLGCAIGCWLKRIFAAQEVGVSIPVPPDLLRPEVSEEDGDEAGAVADAPESGGQDDAKAARDAARAQTAAADDSAGASEPAAPEPAVAAESEAEPVAEPEPEPTQAPAGGGPAGDIVPVETDQELSGRQPAGLREPRGGKADDLKKIRGIGKVNEGRLNSFGIWHFDQIAGWSEEEVEWVDNFLTFPGRITREDWIGQAKTLAGGSSADGRDG